MLGVQINFLLQALSVETAAWRSTFENGADRLIEVSPTFTSRSRTLKSKKLICTANTLDASFPLPRVKRRLKISGESARRDWWMREGRVKIARRDATRRDAARGLIAHLA